MQMNPMKTVCQRLLGLCVERKYETEIFASKQVYRRYKRFFQKDD